jgi:hypothetical protein
MTVWYVASEAGMRRLDRFLLVVACRDRNEETVVKALGEKLAGNYDLQGYMPPPASVRLAAVTILGDKLFGAQDDARRRQLREWLTARLEDGSPVVARRAREALAGEELGRWPRSFDRGGETMEIRVSPRQRTMR